MNLTLSPKDPRVGLDVIEVRLQSFPALSTTLTTATRSANKWVAAELKKPIENWSILTGWLSTNEFDWQTTYSRYARQLDFCLPSLVDLMPPQQITKIHYKLRRHTNRADSKAMLSELGLCNFFARLGYRVELEVSLKDATDVDIALGWGNIADALSYVEVIRYGESDASKRTSEISAACGGIGFPIPFDKEQYRIKTKINEKTKKFTVGDLTLVAIDMTDEPVLGGARPSDIEFAMHEAFTGLRSNGEPTGFENSPIDSQIRELVDAVIWFETDFDNQLMPVRRGIVSNPNSQFLEDEKLTEFTETWLANNPAF